MDKSEKPIELKYNKLMEEAENLSYAITLMERNLDNPKPDATDDWRVSCEIARTKKIIKLDAVSSALAKICSDDIQNKNRLIDKEIKKAGRGIKHEAMIAESLRLRIQIEDAKLNIAKDRVLESQRVKLEKMKIQDATRREHAANRVAKETKKAKANSQTEHFNREMKRLIKDRMGADAYLELVSEVKSNIAIEV